MLRVWPSAAAGAPLGVHLELRPEGPLRLQVLHWAPELSGAAVEAVRLALTASLERPVELRTWALPRRLTRGSSDLAFVRDVAWALHARALAHAPLHACVARPETPGRSRRIPPTDLELHAAVDALLADQPLVTSTSSAGWSLAFSIEPCAS